MIDPQTRVLIIDDQPLVADILRAMLKVLGVIDVEHAVDGWDALLRLRSEPFDLALVDVNLGSMSGLQLLRAVRREPALRHMLMVLITSDRSEEIEREAKAALVNGILYKPFSRNDLGRTIETTLRVWRPRSPDAVAPSSDEAMTGSSLSGRAHYLGQP